MTHRRRRVEAVDVATWQGDVDAGRRPRPPLVLLDVEPYVAEWLTGQDVLDAGVARLAGLWAEQPVLVVTNSARVVSATALPAPWRQLRRARKPFTRLRAFDVPAGSVVVGDQPLQDGLLAWRVQATFVTVPFPPTAPWWARATHRLFTPASRLWLRRPAPS